MGKKPPAGIPVKKPVIKKKRDVEIPARSYRGNDLETKVESRDFQFLRVPGSVDTEMRMRIVDALKRGIIDEGTFREVMEIENVGMEDIVTVVPRSVNESVTGYLITCDETGNVIRKWVRVDSGP